MSIIQDIELAKEVIDNKNTNLFFGLYPFTTENIKETYNIFDFKSKDILTIGSSGDHTLNLYLNDFKSIDFFDINPFCKYYFDLKYNAIKTLKHSDFLKFFSLNYSKDNKEIFNKQLYNKIKLDSETKIFWDELFNKYEGLKLRKSRLFTKDEPDLKSLIRINSYLNKKNYKLLSNSVLKNHHFIKSELSELPNKLNKKYDVIMLSNIAQYIEINNKIKTLEKFKEIILSLSDFLNEDGIILVAYVYDIYFNYQYQIDNIPAIYKINELKSLLSNLDIYEVNSIQEITSKKKTYIKDGIIVYKK